MTQAVGMFKMLQNGVKRLVKFNYMFTIHNLSMGQEPIVDLGFKAASVLQNQHYRL